MAPYERTGTVQHVYFNLTICHNSFTAEHAKMQHWCNWREEKDLRLVCMQAKVNIEVQL